jgi:hypothetical protein
MQVRRFRPLTVSVTVLWLATVLWMTAESRSNVLVSSYPHGKPALGTALLIACPLYIVGIGVWRTIGHGALEAAATEEHLASA